MTTFINLVSVNGDRSITRMHVNVAGIAILSGGRKLKTISWTMVARVEPIADLSRIQLRIHAWSISNKTDLQFRSLDDMWWFGSFADGQMFRNKAPIVGQRDLSNNAPSISSNPLTFGFSQPQNVRLSITQRPMQMLQVNPHEIACYPKLHNRLDKTHTLFKSKCDAEGLYEFDQWYMPVGHTPWTKIQNVRFDDSSKVIVLFLSTGAQRKVAFANDEERKNFLVEFNFYKNLTWNRFNNFIQ